MADDFGFSIVDAPVSTRPSPSPDARDAQLTEISSKLDGIEKLLTSSHAPEDKLKQLEEIIIPLLESLSQNPESEYIKWPNRKPVLDAKIKEVYRITRGK